MTTKLTTCQLCNSCGAAVQRCRTDRHILTILFLLGNTLSNPCPPACAPAFTAAWTATWTANRSRETLPVDTYDAGACGSSLVQHP